MFAGSTTSGASIVLTSIIAIIMIGFLYILPIIIAVSTKNIKLKMIVLFNLIGLYPVAFYFATAPKYQRKSKTILPRNLINILGIISSFGIIVSHFIAEFNKNFAQMKKNADKEAKWLKNTELLNEIDKAINFEGISDTVSAIADVISVMTYVSEYMYNDKFAIESMEWFLNNNYSKEYLSKATLNSCSTYIKSLDTNVATYSAYRYFCDNIGSILGDSVKALGGKGISSVIGANANWMLFAWSIAKNTTYCK